MPNIPLRIVFMGTPDFAVPSLRALLDQNYDIAAVVTAPDKPSGRGRRIEPSAVKRFSLENNLPLLQPSNLKDPAFNGALKEIAPDLQVVVAFRILPLEVWSLPRLGTVNLHASLLPEYRGAAPMNWAIINGEKETGITTFLLQQDVDTGAVLLSEKVSITDEMTVGDLHDVLSIRGAALLKETIERLANGTAKPVPQSLLSRDGQLLHNAPKLTHLTGRISWNKSCRQIVNLIRGLSPVPGAYSDLITTNGEEIYIRILSATCELVSHDFPAGRLIIESSRKLGVCVPDGIVWIHRLQPSGRKPMLATDFLNGHRPAEEWSFKTD